MEPYTRRDFFFALVSPHTTLTHVAWMEIILFCKIPKFTEMLSQEK